MYLEVYCCLLPFYLDKYDHILFTRPSSAPKRKATHRTFYRLKYVSRIELMKTNVFSRRSHKKVLGRNWLQFCSLHSFICYSDGCKRGGSIFSPSLRMNSKSKSYPCYLLRVWKFFFSFFSSHLLLLLLLLLRKLLL